jgi:hypothetical protein
MRKFAADFSGFGCGLRVFVVGWPVEKRGKNGESLPASSTMIDRFPHLPLTILDYHSNIVHIHTEKPQLALM